ncbi:DNA mismatch repair endonuclease MutL [Porphyromonas circumdentaria]|uniref:DNA mismatch repair endonuclease MutL n=1 Tax=Porphyromonas circumdentaria TaxID=29524 RepID=UPI0026DCCFD0|nr:DNA mismatch repair endonuclease MutL [Porphyromonas circumdentaria]MDO4723039.1 DNA mismatch repair endonuclease MutL [Porphyromonas circumdentaria]
MSEIIRVLPESIANQIAAGEVIQRPASVLKELVENAIDAGATQIRIEVEEAGRALLRVSDNGSGMSPMDARMAFERHATSKISSVEDLFSLNSMGFRGEALASIASVAQVELITRRASDEMGTMLCLNGSEVISSKPTAAPVGSTFTVRNLFFNVPARRRFLKTNATELRHLQEQFERIALIYPSISFSFYSEGVPVLDLPKTTQLRRVVDTLGKQFEKTLIPITFKNELATIEGFVCHPSGAKKRNPEQYFFVNGRFMKHAYFHKAVNSVYEQLLPPNMYPNYFINFTIDPSRIDVNIHPTKTEIKFLDEQAIFKILAIVIRQTLNLKMETPMIDFDPKNIVDIPIYEGHSEDILPAPDTTIDPNYDPFAETSEAPQAKRGGKGAARISWQDMFRSFESHKSSEPSSFSSFSSLFSSHIEELTPPDTTPVKEKNLSKKANCFIYAERYIVTSLLRGIVFIDAYRAKMRIAYEDTLRELKEGNLQVKTSLLLTPEVCSFPVREEAQIELIIPQLESFGFEITPLGKGEYSVNSAPYITEGSIKEVIEQAISVMLAKKDFSMDELVEVMASTITQKKKGYLRPLLSLEEAEEIIAQLFSCSESTYTPTGKKIIHLFEEEEIKKLFML